MLLVYFIHLSTLSAFSCRAQQPGNHRTVMYPSCSAVGSLRLLTCMIVQRLECLFHQRSRLIRTLSSKALKTDSML